MSDESSGLFSVVGFVVAIGAIAIGTAAGLAVVPVVGSFLGMLLGGFVAGIAVEERPLVESGLAAVLVNVGVLAWGGFVGAGIAAGITALASIGTPALLGSIVLSFAVGAFGAHFGDDLRDGLTDSVESPPSRSISDTVVAPASDEADEESVREEPPTEQTAVEGRTEGDDSDRQSDEKTSRESTNEAADVELEYE